MKQQTLISSIEYGLMIEEKSELVQNEFYADYFQRRAAFDSKILSKPHLSQFIPCVEENGVWRVLEEVNKSTHTNEECDQYQTALSKVLFSGWEYKGSRGNSITIWNTKLKIGMTFVDGKINASFSDLANQKYPLTENGVIHFNLKF